MSITERPFRAIDEKTRINSFIGAILPTWLRGRARGGDLAYFNGLLRDTRNTKLFFARKFVRVRWAFIPSIDWAGDGPEAHRTCLGVK